MTFPRAPRLPADVEPDALADLLQDCRELPDRLSARPAGVPATRPLQPRTPLPAIELAAVTAAEGWGG
jgi:hypothetical protein